MLAIRLHQKIQKLLCWGIEGVGLVQIFQTQKEDEKPPLSAQGGQVKYGILDDEGNVVRWVWEKPDYPHIVVKVKRQRKKRFDPFGYPDALF